MLGSDVRSTAVASCMQAGDAREDDDDSSCRSVQRAAVCNGWKGSLLLQHNLDFFANAVAIMRCAHTEWHAELRTELLDMQR